MRSYTEIVFQRCLKKKDAHLINKLSIFKRLPVSFDYRGTFEFQKFQKSKNNKNNGK